MRVLLFLSYCSLINIYSEIEYVKKIMGYMGIITHFCYALYLAFKIFDNKMVALHPRGYSNLQKRIKEKLPLKM